MCAITGTQSVSSAEPAMGPWQSEVSSLGRIMGSVLPEALFDDEVVELVALGQVKKVFPGAFP